MIVLPTRLATAGAAVAVPAEPGRVFTGRHTGGDTGVMAVAAIAVPAAERGVLPALSAPAAAASARPARARPGPHRGMQETYGRCL
ncbi:hypothetical protein [Streptomyces tendae]|uniref:hypothetical protein n=1 Tax=Streptomyces tendae TaxID=1932 RepID=UPI003D755DAC